MAIFYHNYATSSTAYAPGEKVYNLSCLIALGIDGSVAFILLGFVLGIIVRFSEIIVVQISRPLGVRFWLAELEPLQRTAASQRLQQDDANQPAAALFCRLRFGIR